MAQSIPVFATVADAPNLIFVPSGQELLGWIDRDALAAFLHAHLKPCEDTLSDIRRGLDDALENRPGPGGFVLLGDDPAGLEVGDTIKFRVSYSALLRLMNDKYVVKTLLPNVERFKQLVSNSLNHTIPPILATCSMENACVPQYL